MRNMTRTFITGERRYSIQKYLTWLQFSIHFKSYYKYSTDGFWISVMIYSTILDQLGIGGKPHLLNYCIECDEI